MSEHTPGKLTLEEVVNDSGHIKHLCPVDRRGLSLLTVIQQEEAKFAAVYNDDDARRLVAAWNACDGIDTVLLESLRAPIRDISCIPGLVAEADSLRAVNAELLEALEDTLQTLCWLAFGECRNITNRPLMTAQQAEKSARAAIASARKQKGEA